MSNVRLDMAGRPLPDRTYPAETGSEGYTLHERTLGQWLEYWAETTPDKEYIVYSDRDLRFTWSKFNERVDNLAKGLIAIGVKRGGRRTYPIGSPSSMPRPRSVLCW